MAQKAAAKGKLPKSELPADEKNLMRKAERAAKKRGMSLFNWLRMGGLELGKRPSKKFDAPKILELSQKKPQADAQKAAKVGPALAPSDEAFLRPASAVAGAAPPMAKSAKRFVLETELRNPILRTEFDRVLSIVQREGTIRADALKKKLGMDAATLRECYKMLQKAGKVRIEYPLFGPPMLVSVDFEKAKKRRALIKKGVVLENEEENSE